MTKKQKKEKDSKQRVLVQFNIGERVFKSKRDYNRKDNKVDIRKVDL